MTRMLAGVLVALFASAAEGQERYELGLGVGAASVTQAEGLGSNTSAALNASLGIRLRGGMAVVFETALFGTRDEEPLESDLRVVETGTPGIGSVEVVRRPEVVQVLSVQAGVRVPVGGFYARPSLGMARHAFPSYTVGATSVQGAETSHEWGPAVAFAFGRGFDLSGFRLAVEGVAHWSGGEDSSPDRTAFALRLVPHLAF